MSCTNKKKILEIEELSVSFLQYKGKTSRQSWLPVISGLSVAVREGELVAVVGSSGSGKSLLAHAILGILPYNANVSGTMKFQGELMDKSIGIASATLKTLQRPYLRRAAAFRADRIRLSADCGRVSRSSSMVCV